MSDSSSANKILDWIEFREAALRWARERGERPAENDRLDRRFCALSQDYAPLLRTKLSALPHFVRELQSLYRETRLRRVTSALRELGRVRGRCFGRTADFETARRSEAEAEGILAAVELGESDKKKLQEVFSLAAVQGRRERVAAERAAADIHRLLGGYLPYGMLARLWSGPEKIFALLLCLERDIRRLALVAYEERYGRPVKELVIERFRGPVGQALVALLEGDLPRGILGYLEFLAPNRLEVMHAVEKCIWQLPRAERRKIDAEFAASGSAHEVRVERLPAELGLALKHLLSGSWAEFQAYCVAYDLRQERHWPLVERLLHCSFEERQRIASAFRGCLDAELASVLREALPGGSPAELAQALLRGDGPEILAWRGKCVIEHFSGEWLGDLLRGKARREFIQAYERRFGIGSLERGIEERYGRRDREILIDILHEGKVGAGKLLWFATAGIGTDERAVLSLLENTDRETQSRMTEDYRAIWNERAPWYEKPFPRLFGDLGTRLRLECAGDNWCDLQEAIRLDAGADKFSRLLRLYEHERSGALLKALDFFSHEGSVMDRDVKRAKEFHAKCIAPGSSSAEEQFQLDALIELSEADCSVFRRLKHFIGDGVTTAAAGAGVFTSALALTVLDTDILVLMCAVGLTSAVLRCALKQLLKGRGYHRDEVLADCAFAAVDGATLYLGRLFRQALIRIGAKFTSRLGLKTSIVRFLRRLREVSAEVEAETLREIVDEDQDGENAADGEAQSEGVSEPVFRDILRRLYEIANVDGAVL